MKPDEILWHGALRMLSAVLGHHLAMLHMTGDPAQGLVSMANAGMIALLLTIRRE